MKVLIITYYWPPAGGSGVQRWLKFVKYLPQFGFTPVVFTPQNANYPILDETLQQEVAPDIEVLKIPIKEPNSFLSFFSKKKNKESAGFLDPNPSFFGKMAQYIRANYFIPDARKFWIKPSVKFLSKYLVNNKIDVVITTGPPHSLHLIGLQLKELHHVKWIADFRDPWTEIDYFHQLPLTENAKNKHEQLEKEVLEKADVVLVVGKEMQKSFSKFSKNVKVITNGFDNEVIEDIAIEVDKSFSLVHIGMMNADRNPIHLWKALKEIIDNNEDFASKFQLKLIGKIADEVEQSLKENELWQYTQVISYLPHNEVLTYQKRAQVLLLPVNNVPSAKAIITGKVFEYLQAKRPILAIAPPDGDLADIIHTTNSGVVVDFNNEQSLKKAIVELYNSYILGNLKVDSTDIDQYHRKSLTKKLSTIIKELNS